MVNLFGLIFIPLLFSIPAVVLLIYGLLCLKRIHQIAKKLPSPLDKLKPGFVKVEGEAGYVQPLKGPVSGEDCAYYKYELQRLTKFTRITTNRHGEDEEVEVEDYQTYDSGESKNPIYVMDDKGQVKVIPDDATFYIEEIEKQDESTNPPKWIHTESHIKSKDRLVVIGTAIEDPSSAKGGHYVILKGDRGKSFLIISKKPEKVIFRLQLKGFMSFLGIMILGVMCTLIVYVITIA